jgi:pimeloyl-ACP methyl ester carboxylesterase
MIVSQATRYLEDLAAEPGSVASFVPGNPGRVLVLAHGYPWPDGSMPDSALAEYAHAAVARWTPFARMHRALVLAPVFGGRHFPRYQEMRGRVIAPAEFVDYLVVKAAREHIPRFGGRFHLHGHSAGAQFAARYLVTRPQSLASVVLSAPSAFPMPDAGVPWPDGMAPAAIQDVGGSPPDGPASALPAAGLIPERDGWLAAAAEVAVTVLVGSRDTEPRPPGPGQPGSTRIERATGWVESMRRHAEARMKTSAIRLVVAEGLDHDEEAMAVPAQQVFARGWRTAGGASD